MFLFVIDALQIHEDDDDDDDDYYYNDAAYFLASNKCDWLTEWLI